VPAAATIPRELLTDVVPHLLAVEEHAVEIENNGVGQTAE
jgi:hypothetical protein